MDIFNFFEIQTSRPVVFQTTMLFLIFMLIRIGASLCDKKVSPDYVKFFALKTAFLVGASIVGYKTFFWITMLFGVGKEVGGIDFYNPLAKNQRKTTVVLFIPVPKQRYLQAILLILVDFIYYGLALSVQKLY